MPYNPKNEFSQALSDAVTCLKKGGVIAYPTEAVYGLGCDPDHADAVARILQLKQRRELSFQEWEGKIKNYLFNSEMRHRLDAWVQILRKDAFVQIMDQDLYKQWQN